MGYWSANLNHDVRTNVLTSFISTVMLSCRHLLCDSYGMRTRTAKIFVSTMFALKPPFSFSTIPTRLRSVTSLLRMRNVDNGRNHRAGFDSIGRSYFL